MQPPTIVDLDRYPVHDLAEGRSSLSAVAYDEFDRDSPPRALYEWDALAEYLALGLGTATLHRYDDPLGALNVASMTDGDERRKRDSCRT